MNIISNLHVIPILLIMLGADKIIWQAINFQVRYRSEIRQGIVLIGLGATLWDFI